MRVLLTGGAGFIGSHLADRLVEGGHHVVCLDDFSTGNPANVAHLLGRPEFRLVTGSVLDRDLVGELVRPADVVVHLAAAVGVKLIVDEPLRSLQTNLKGTENVLEAATTNRTKVLVASTSEVYGRNGDRLHENAERVLGSTSVSRWSYSVAKSVDEIMAFAYWRERGVPTVIVRLFNTVGPRQSGAYGMVVPRFVERALSGDDLTVYGDGTQTRCFGHVADVVRAIAGLLEEPSAVGEAFNIGSDEEISVLDLARRVIERTGSRSGIRLVPYDEAYGEGYEDMARRRPDTRKVRLLLGWRPERNLDQIVDDTAAFLATTRPGALAPVPAPVVTPASEIVAPKASNVARTATAAVLRQYFGLKAGETSAAFVDEVSALTAEETSELLDEVTRREGERPPAVLVVEDDPGVGQVLELALGLQGHDVEVAPNRATAMDRLAGDGPGVVILDLNLPDGSGMDILRHIREQYGPSLPVLILSGFRQEESVVRALELGADDYIVKPFSPRELIARINRRLVA